MDENARSIAPAGDVPRVTATIDRRSRGSKAADFSAVLGIIGFEGVGWNFNVEVVIAPAVVVIVIIVVTTFPAVFALDLLPIRSEGFLFAGTDAFNVGPYAKLATQMVEKRAT